MNAFLSLTRQRGKKQHVHLVEAGSDFEFHLRVEISVGLADRTYII